MVDLSTLSHPPPAAFAELPGMRGLRIARIGQADGKTLEIVEAVKGVVIPTLTHPSAERGRVLAGKIRFVVDGEARTLGKGETWEVGAGVAQGPHVVLEDDTRVVILREGKSALDL